MLFESMSTLVACELAADEQLSLCIAIEMREVNGHEGVRKGMLQSDGFLGYDGTEIDVC